MSDDSLDDLFKPSSSSAEDDHDEDFEPGSDSSGTSGCDCSYWATNSGEDDNQAQKASTAARKKTGKT
ncbi:hypothetical protein L916_03597 [Phytophthora nicotianae]|uniref:Uncharacterized protein n=2 Tax=Phytophthora nicotianae TaxID=4792 RepID=W2JLP9_PHYNI|nr:hypothetical protein L916_03597 [Phytophthora nicotianae]ETO81937.1 hypothetical protein F444_03829 [Phytophthora nicotianae P1976]